MLKNVMAALILLVPCHAFAQDVSNWNMGMEKRVTDLESRVSVLEKSAALWNQGTKGDVCPCPEGKCICPPGKCDCPNCPEHLSSDRVIEIYVQNKEAIDKIWESMADDEDGTMKKAVQAWLKKQGTKSKGRLSDDTLLIKGKEWKGTMPTNKGREVLLFTSSTCPPCPAAIERLGSLTKDIVYVDCTEGGGPGDTLAAMLRVDSYPTLVATDDGIKSPGLHTEGDSVGSFLAGKWLGKQSAESGYKSVSRSDEKDRELRAHLVSEHGYQQSAVDRMSNTEVQDAHNRSHGTPSRSSFTPLKQSSSSRGRVTASPSYSTGRTVVRYGGSTWTWPGNLRQHLESVHGVNTAGLSDSQLRTVHDNLHNTGSSGITGGSYSSPRTTSGSRAGGQYQPVIYTSSGYGYSYGSSCPTCPR